MLDNKRILAVIPARAGSKRLPNKNILNFHGQPLIAYTIAAANKSDYIDTVVVSSDSDQILNISNNMGVCSHKRPNSLAEDTSTSIDVAIDVLDSFPNYDVLIWLQPTSPLRSYIQIDESLRLFTNKSAQSVISVCETTHSPFWVNTLTETGKLTNFFNANIANIRSQDLKVFHQLNGAIYISDIQALRLKKAFLECDSYAYVMSKETSIDIDTALDFKIAEAIYTDLQD